MPPGNYEETKCWSDQSHAAYIRRVRVPPPVENWTDPFHGGMLPIVWKSREISDELVSCGRFLDSAVIIEGHFLRSLYFR